MPDTVDARIAMGFNPVPLGPNMGQAIVAADNLLKFRQAQQEAERQNALRNVLGSPGALDATGNPTPETMNRVMGLDPSVGIQLQNNVLARTGRDLQMQAARTKQAFDTVDYLNDAYAPIQEQYEQNIAKGMSPDVASREAQNAVDETTDRLRNSGVLSPTAAQALPTRFDPAQFQRMSMQSKQYMQWWKDQQAAQKEARTEREKGEEQRTDPEGNLFTYRPNMPPGQNAVYPDGSPVPVDKVRRSTKERVGAAGSAAAAQEADVQTISSAELKQSRGQPLTPEEQTAFDAAKARIAARAQAKSGIAGITAFEGADNFSVTGKAIPTDLHGDDFLKQIRPDIANQVKALADGRMQFPSSFALRPGMGASGPNASYWQNMLDAVSRYDPTFDATNYNARASTLRSFTSGPDAKNVTSINMTIGHLGNLADTADKLRNVDFRAYNTLANWLSVQAGRPDVTNFNIAKAAVSSELTRVFRGTGGNEADIQRWENEINSSASPEQLRGAIGTGLALLDSRIGAMNQTFSRGMNRPATIQQFLDPRSLDTLRRLEKKTGTEMEELGGVAGREARPTQPTQLTDEQKAKLPHPKSLEEARGLPAGTQYVKPDGTVLTTPGAKPEGATEPTQRRDIRSEKRDQPAATLQPMPDDLRERARAAIAAGKSRAAVIKRLRDNGVDPSGL